MCGAKIGTIRPAETHVEFQPHFFTHTPSIAFRHLPPNSARIAYATEGALFISAQASIDDVSALRMVWVLLRLWKQHSVILVVTV